VSRRLVVPASFHLLADWELVGDFPGYQVSDDARVLSMPRMIWHPGNGLGAGHWLDVGGTELKPFPGKGGYPQVHLRRDGVKYTRKVHKLVAEAFIGPCPPGEEVRHNDGDPANCRRSNLCYGTSRENHQDAIRHGTWPHGERHGNAALTDDFVREIRTRYAAGGVFQRELAAEFGIEQAHVSKIIHRRIWAHVA
jgi:HNH endonuclease